MNAKFAKVAFTYAGVVMAAMLAFAAPVRGELVFDDEGAGQKMPTNPLVSDGTMEERESVRQVLDSAESAYVTRQNPEAAQPTVENLGRAELLRRERLRKELQNEDILQVRLEELRLRDEMRRTKELLGGEVPSEQGATGPTGTTAAAPVEQVVVSPELQPSPFAAQPAQPAVQDAVVTSQAAPAAVVPLASNEAVFEAGAAEEEDEKNRIYVQPRGGVADFLDDEANQITGRFGAGVGAGMEVSENLQFEVGYTYAEYGVAAMAWQPTVNWVQQMARNPEPIVMKQNVVDAGLKMNLLGSDAKLRPFLGGGAAYSKGFVNYDERALQALRASGQYQDAQDYEVSSFLGYVATGFDLRLSKAVSVSAALKYYTVLTSRENQNFNQFAYNYNMPYGGYPMGYNYGAYSTDVDKQQAGATLSRADFYSVLVGVSFVF